MAKLPDAFKFRVCDLGSWYCVVVVGIPHACFEAIFSDPY